MDRSELAKLLVMALRKYMKEKTPHNNIAARPVLELLSSAASPGTRGTTDDLQAAMQILHEAKICQIVMQQTRTPGEVIPMLQMTLEGRDLTDGQVVARLFPERN